MGATKIMVIRHAEKPGSYNGVNYFGVDGVGSVSGVAGEKHLVTLGWERAGALVGLFALPHGPETPVLATPQFLFASDPVAQSDDVPGRRRTEPATPRDPDGAGGEARADDRYESS